MGDLENFDEVILVVSFQVAPHGRRGLQILNVTALEALEAVQWHFGAIFHLPFDVLQRSY